MVHRVLYTLYVLYDNARKLKLNTNLTEESHDRTEYLTGVRKLNVLEEVWNTLARFAM